MKKIFFFLNMIICPFLLRAQPPGATPGSGYQRQGGSGIAHLFGKLVDNAGKGVGNASVLLLEGRLDTVTKRNKEVLLKGVFTQGNGDFSFEDLTTRGSLKLKISATGYTPYEQNVGTDRPAGAQPNPGVPNLGANRGLEKDLGKIMLKTDVQ